MVYFAKNSNFCSIDFLHFFANRGKSVQKKDTSKEKWDHRKSKIVQSRQSCSGGRLPCHCSLYYLARARCITWRVNCVRSKDAQKQFSTKLYTCTRTWCFWVKSCRRWIWKYNRAIFPTGFRRNLT